jgi:inosose dehydratase
VAREEHGLVPVVHPHAGSYLEFADEIEAVLDAVDVGLCLDTGHAAYAGLDPVALYRRYADRIPYLHLKDVDAAVRTKAVGSPLDFWQSISAGIFCPLGAGLVDFSALTIALSEHGFDGWATVEQDRDPGGDPVADLVTSRTFLEGLGIADAPARR